MCFYNSIIINGSKFIESATIILCNTLLSKSLNQTMYLSFGQKLANRVKVMTIPHRKLELNGAKYTNGFEVLRLH